MNEIVEPVRLSDMAGRLNPAARGWARRPLITGNLVGSSGRKKRWNYWGITTDDFLFSVTVADIDYIGMAFIYLLDFETRRFVEETVVVPLGLGVALPDGVEDDVSFEHRRASIHFRHEGERVRLLATVPDFGGEAMMAAFTVHRPPEHDTLNVVVPWSDRRFQLTSKQVALPAQGGVSVGERAWKAKAGQGWGCLDFGRGKWPYRSIWNWGAAAGKLADGRTLGINLGAGWTDGTGANENAVVLDGRMTRLGDVTFEMSPADRMAPWRLRSCEGDAVDLTFEPIYERVAKTSLVLLHSEVHQMIGHHRGVIRLNGETLEVDGFVGWAEDHIARW